MLDLDITLDQLVVFAAVARTGSFSAAARDLNRAQPAVSYAIAGLETQLGSQLFDRTSYRPTLTERGEVLLQRAQAVLAEAGEMISLAGALNEGVETSVRLAVDVMLPPNAMIPALQDFGARWPDVRLELRAEVLAAPTVLLQRGDADVAIGLVLRDSADEFVVHTIASEHLTTVCGPQHPLAQLSGTIPVRVLRQHTQLVLSDRLEGGSQTSCGVVSERPWRISDLSLRLRLLRANIGFAKMPRHMLASELAEGALVELETELGETTIDFRLFYGASKRPGPATAWLIERLLEGT